MSPLRKTALVAGVLYLLTFVSIPTLFLYGPVHDPKYIFGGVLVLALVATILAKPNTAKDVQAAGDAFAGAIKQAQAG